LNEVGRVELNIVSLNKVGELNIVNMNTVGNIVSLNEVGVEYCQHE